MTTFIIIALMYGLVAWFDEWAARDKRKHYRVKKKQLN
jgi:hypothetical protein